MWIHEQKNWPNFSWDVCRISSKLAAVRYKQGHLLGLMEAAGFDLQREASLAVLTEDVVKSSAIEGENLDPREVRSSIARRLGLNVAGLVSSSRNVDGIVEIMLDATQKFPNPLTKERLFDWHAALFPTGRSGMHKIIVGHWRSIDTNPMRVISGPLGRKKVHFEAPGGERLEKEMTAFLEWFEQESDIDPVLKAGIAHFWFVTIHPFEDGNGRIARVIGDMALARADNIAERFYSLSAQIESERKDYYNKLERQQSGSLDITFWIEWFLDCLERAIIRAHQTLIKVLFKSSLWKKVSQCSINQRQRFIINSMLEDGFVGFMNTSKYAKLAKCSTDTALRDIQSLKMQGIFLQNSSAGRSTSYKLPDTI